MRNAEGIWWMSSRWRKPIGVFLNAGRRPKKAMNVRREMVMVTMRMDLMNDMVDVMQSSASRGRDGQIIH